MPKAKINPSEMIEAARVINGLVGTRKEIRKKARELYGDYGEVFDAIKETRDRVYTVMNKRGCLEGLGFSIPEVLQLAGQENTGRGITDTIRWLYYQLGSGVCPSTLRGKACQEPLCEFRHEILAL